MLQVASLDDVMPTEAKTILQRLSAKHYADIAAMLNAGVALEKGFAVRAMFGHRWGL